MPIIFEDKRLYKDSYRLIRNDEHEIELYLDIDRTHSRLIMTFSEATQELRVFTRLDNVVTHIPPSDNVNIEERFIHKFLIHPK